MYHIVVCQVCNRQHHLGVDIGSSDVFFLKQLSVGQIFAGAIFHQQIGQLVVIRGGNTDGIYLRAELLIGGGANAGDLRLLGIAGHCGRNHRGVFTDIACPVGYHYFIEVSHAVFYRGIVVADCSQRRAYRGIIPICGQSAVYPIGIDVRFLAHSPENADITVLTVCRHIVGGGRRGLIHNILGIRRRGIGAAAVACKVLGNSAHIQAALSTVGQIDHRAVFLLGRSNTILHTLHHFPVGQVGGNFKVNIPNITVIPCGCIEGEGMVIPIRCRALVGNDRGGGICRGFCIEHIGVLTHIASCVHTGYPVCIASAGGQIGEGITQGGDVAGNSYPTVIGLLLQNKILGIASLHIIPGKGQLGGKGCGCQAGHLIRTYIIDHILCDLRLAGIAFGIVYRQAYLHNRYIRSEIYGKTNGQAAVIGSTDLHPVFTVQGVFIAATVYADIILRHRRECGGSRQNGVIGRNELQHLRRYLIHKGGGPCDHGGLTLCAIGANTCYIVGVGYALFHRGVFVGYGISAVKGLNEDIFFLSFFRAVDTIGIGSHLAGASPGQQDLANIGNCADIDDSLGDHFIGHGERERYCAFEAVNAFYHNGSYANAVISAVGDLQFRGSIQRLSLIGKIHLGLQGLALIEGFVIFQRNIRLLDRRTLQRIYKVIAVAMAANRAGIQRIAVFQIGRRDHLAVIAVAAIHADLTTVRIAAVIGGDHDLRCAVGYACDHAILIHRCHRSIQRVPGNALIGCVFRGHICNQLLGSADIQRDIGIVNVHALCFDGSHRDGGIHRHRLHIFQVCIGGRDQMDTDLIFAIGGILSHIEYQCGQGAVCFIIGACIPHGCLIVGHGQRLCFIYDLR